eukprot:gene7304-8120_t
MAKGWFFRFLLHFTAIFIFINIPIAAGKVKKTKVLILGAGSAGIGFANTLHKNGVSDFLVLDAQNYIGGRLRKTQFSGLTIQEGAGWIHDFGSDNPFALLVKKAASFNITSDNYTDFIVRDVQGRLVPNGGKETFQKIQQTIPKVDKVNSDMKKNKESDIPLKAALQMSGWEAKTPLDNALEFHISDFENAYPPLLVSSRQAGFTGAGDGEKVVTDQRGYQYLIEQLTTTYKSKIILSTTVKAINYTSSMVRVEVANGVLASSGVKFNPALPGWKMKAIYMLPMAQYTKIFLKFPIKFWENNRYILVANDERGHYVHYQNLDRPGLFEGEKILVATVVGFESIRVEKLTDAQVKEEVMKVLRRAYPSAVNATDIFLSRWSRDNATYGTWSNPVVGTDEYTFKYLKAPVNKRLWFGGEAATDSDNYGYAHGAFQGAIKQGLQMVKCLKDSTTCPVFKPRPPPSKLGAALAHRLGNALLVLPFIALLF